MIEELKQKAIESVKNIIKDNPIDEDYQTKDIYFRDLIDAYIAGATENGIQIHNLRKNPNDLPECEESKQITFYVEEWIESIQKYRKHYCLGFYKKSFLNDDVKLFVEKSKGYENEHLPKTVLFWYENPTV